jgi:hypothetical protein
VEARPPMVLGRPVLIVVDIQRGYGLTASDTGIEMMDGVTDLVANAELTSVESSTVTKEPIASRATRVPNYGRHSPLMRASTISPSGAIPAFSVLISRSCSKV